MPVTTLQHPPILPLLTDLYQLTMAYGYWKQGLKDRRASFHLFFRHPPFKGGFTIAAGLEYVVDFVQRYQWDQESVDYLASLTGHDGAPLFEREFFDYLMSTPLNLDIDAVPEGTVVFPYEPLIRVEGPLLQCQLMETPFLTLTNFQGLIATKAARVVLAASGDSVLEFGLRRAQGVDGALTAARAAYIGGCSSTSNVLAGKLFGIPVSGTQAHSWIMSFESETGAFFEYAKAMPNNCVFLVDTYDTLQGVQHAIEVGKWLKSQGKKMLGIRLDSGDLNYLSQQARKALDEAGFEDAAIVASNELDERLIRELKRQGAKISVWGVGTNLITAKDCPALDGVYKLSALQNEAGEWEHKLKLSEQMVKISNPGCLQVRRYRENGENVADAIFDSRAPIPEKWTIVDPLDSTRTKELEAPEYEDLLVPIFREGKLTYELPTLEQIRERVQEELAACYPGMKRFENPHQYIVGLEQGLFERKMELIRKVREKENE